MDWISQIPIFGGAISTIIAFVVVLGVVVFVHEFGHYIVGRWTGIGSEVFSMGFGPVIWSRVDKRGTRWQIAAIPLGGYVKFIGDRNAASTADPQAMAAMSAADRSRSFPGAKLWKRAVTVLAGPVFNFFLALALFSGLIMAQGIVTDSPIVGEVLDMPTQKTPLLAGDKILTLEGVPVSSFSEIYTAALAMEPPAPMTLTVQRDGQKLALQIPYLFPPAVYGVEPLSAADKAGLQRGDVLLSADGVELTSFVDLKKLVEVSRDRPILLSVWRKGQKLDVSITPKLRQYPDDNGGFEDRVMIGVSGAIAFMPLHETPSLLKSVKLASERVTNIILSSLSGIKSMFAGDLSPSNLQGPVGIAQMSEATANQGFEAFISFIAIISTGIGLLNLFPIPMLDGGHLVFYAIEALRGKPLAGKTIERAVSIGLAMVLLLMVFVTYNDILRF